MAESNGHREWFKQAWYDYETAKAMFQSGRYIYSVFMCHMALEKALKGYLLKSYKKVPPKTHDLLYLLTLAKLTLNKDALSFIQILNDVHIRTRYPDNLDTLLQEYTPEITQNILIQSEEILTWIEKKSNEL